MRRHKNISIGEPILKGKKMINLDFATNFLQFGDCPFPPTLNGEKKDKLPEEEKTASEILGTLTDIRKWGFKHIHEARKSEIYQTNTELIETLICEIEYTLNNIAFLMRTWDGHCLAFQIVKGGLSLKTNPYFSEIKKENRHLTKLIIHELKPALI